MYCSYCPFYRQSVMLMRDVTIEQASALLGKQVIVVFKSLGQTLVGTVLDVVVSSGDVKILYYDNGQQKIYFTNVLAIQSMTPLFGGGGLGTTGGGFGGLGGGGMGGFGSGGFGF